MTLTLEKAILSQEWTKDYKGSALVKGEESSFHPTWPMEKMGQVNDGEAFTVAKLELTLRGVL